MIAKFENSLIGRLLISFLVLDLLSIIAYFGTLVQGLMFILLVALFLVCCIIRPGWAVLVVVSELILGSQGYWFFVPISDGGLSLRMALFIILMVRFVTSLKLNDWRVMLASRIIRWWFLALLIIGLAGINGLVRQDFSTWFLDINGYLFLFYFLPFWWWRSTWVKYIWPVALASIGYLIFKTLVLLFFYTHFSSFDLLPIYTWVRNTGFGEITYAGGGWFRVFSQSQVFAMMAAAFFLANLLLTNNKKILTDIFGLTAGVLSVAVLLASMSRSFWLGILLSLAVSVIHLLIKKIIDLNQLWFFIKRATVIVMLAVGVLIMVVQFPWPKPLTADLSALITRSSQGWGEAAGQSRVRLLKPLYDKIYRHFFIGDGFGSQVTYFSTDPRVVRSTAGASGQVTTYAFEWGYLDIWLKMGLVGLLVYLLFYFNLFKNAMAKISNWRQDSVALSILVAVTALFITNITTPYLNHPLGIGILMIIGIYLHFYGETQVII